MKSYCIVQKPFELDVIASSMAQLLHGQTVWGHAIETPIVRSRSIQRISQSKNSLQFLVADDNAFVRKAVSRQIKGTFQNSEVKECVDGKEAVDELKAKHNEYDYIILDNQMPNIEGLEAIRLIREFESTTDLHKIPIICIQVCVTIIVLTGDDTQEIVRQGKEAGANHICI